MIIPTITSYHYAKKLNILCAVPDKKWPKTATFLVSLVFLLIFSIFSRPNESLPNFMLPHPYSQELHNALPLYINSFTISSRL